MNGAGSDAPPVDGGEFLLNLLNRRPTHHQPQQQPPPPPPPPNQILTNDPDVAAFGPTVPVPLPHHHQLFPSGAPPPPPWAQQFQQASPPTHLGPHGYYFQSPNPSPNLNHFLPSVSPPGIAQFGARSSGFAAPNSNLSSAHQRDVKDLVFGSMRASEGPFNPLAPPMQDEKILDLLLSPEDRRNLEFLRLKEQSRQLGLDGSGRENGFGINSQSSSSSDGSNRRVTGYWDGPGNSSNIHGAVAPPPGFSNKQNYGGGVMRGGELRYQGGGGGVGRNEMERRLSAVDGNRGLSGQVDQPGPPAGSRLRSAPASDIEESMMANHAAISETGRQVGNGMMRDGRRSDDLGGNADMDELEEQFVDSLGLGDETDEKSDQKKPQGMRDKEYRSDKRGQYMMGQRLRLLKRQIACRGDIDRWNSPLLAIYDSLIPAEEEKAKQKQLLTLLEKVVWKEWPEARLFLYGSCANSFGFSKSDIDVCLTIGDPDINKADVLLKLADLLQLENLQNVQALTRARVPIVKLMDPATGISCDICINNVLAVVNTKLLRDYAQIDKRLRQLVFLVKHWAKSRGVNETYQGTLSSYAYVLMCIHFLQHRRPAILPCLQEMKTTYSVRIGNVACSFFDQVESLTGFGSRNGETIAQLVWSFFNYWAYCHDYANDVISVRTGTILSKRHKDWTRRVGNDRHLICIEDPFETSHDLGRVVDKRSIRVLREEFERAAKVIQHDPNPCVTLFEPYVPS